MNHEIPRNATDERLTSSNKISVYGLISGYAVVPDVESTVNNSKMIIATQASQIGLSAVRDSWRVP